MNSLNQQINLPVTDSSARRRRFPRINRADGGGFGMEFCPRLVSWLPGGSKPSVSITLNPWFKTIQVNLGKLSVFDPGGLSSKSSLSEQKALVFNHFAPHFLRQNRSFLPAKTTRFVTPKLKKS
jgi:hypothetical protein